MPLPSLLESPLKFEDIGNWPWKDSKDVPGKALAERWQLKCRMIEAEEVLTSVERNVELAGLIRG